MDTGKSKGDETDLAIVVDREETEKVRRHLKDLGLLDPGRRIIEKDEVVEIPVKGLPMVLEERYETVIQGSPQYIQESKDPYDRIVSSLDLEDDLGSLLPRRWEMVGDVLLLKLDDSMEAHFEEVARAYAEELGAKAVLRDMGVDGEFRLPRVEPLWGDADTETIHTENKVRFHLDPSTIMFSSGNIDERIRMATVPDEGEVIVDMFAGIGYFSIPMAVHSSPSRIIAIEKNKEAYDYLVRNCELNDVEDIVEPVLADNRDYKDKVADRVIMGYLPTPREFLPRAVKILKRNKEAIIHYHENAPEFEIPGALYSRVAGAAGVIGRGARMLNHRWIKSYAPRVWHAVVDVEIW